MLLVPTVLLLRVGAKTEVLCVVLLLQEKKTIRMRHNNCHTEKSHPIGCFLRIADWLLVKRKSRKANII